MTSSFLVISRRKLEISDIPAHLHRQSGAGEGGKPGYDYVVCGEKRFLAVILNEVKDLAVVVCRRKSKVEILRLRLRITTSSCFSPETT